MTDDAERATYDPESGVEVPPVPPPGAPEEPLVTVTVITAAASAVLALAVALGAPVSEKVQTAILAVVAVTAPIVVGFVSRSRVWSPASVRRLAAVEHQRGVQGQ